MPETTVDQRHDGLRHEVGSPAPPSLGRRHLHDVDIVRLTTVLGVLCVHGISLLLADTEPAGAALAVLHVTREVFLFLSAFVLSYSTRSKPVTVTAFWRRRIPLVLAPYLVWSFLYVLADGDLVGPSTVVSRYGRDILSGAAHFHLYFLLLTLQLYVIFPALRSWLARRSHHGRILLIALAWQLAFTGAIWFRLDVPVLSTWLHHPGTWLPSYVLYVVAGVIAALHLDDLRARIGASRATWGMVALAAATLGVVAYELDVHVLGESFLHASEVFSPVIVVESAAAITAQFALGLWVAQRAGPRLRRLLETSSDLSFGIYLAHPLLYGAILDVAAAFGQHGLDGLPSGVGLAVVIVVVAPLTYVVTGTAVWLVRRTPLSVALTGRRQRRPAVPAVASPVPA